MFEDKLQKLAEELHSVDAVKFGEFLTKSGMKTPVYFDLRVIVSYPSLMQNISDLLYEFAVKDSLCDHLCGVPYTALPLATLLAVRSGKSMLMRRKEAKSYGTKKMIEGHYSSGQSCLIIEDVVTSGSSVMETVKDLRREGLVSTEAVVILNREQGGAASLAASDVDMRALFTLSDLVARLVSAGRVDAAVQETVARYLSETQCEVQKNGSSEILDIKKMPFEKRSELAENQISKRLFSIMAAKQTNLCISVDLETTAAILDLLEKIGEHVCLVKTHVDIIVDFTSDFVDRLRELAKKYNFLIMEDRKYADIGNTVALQYGKGLYKVSTWADLVTAHSLPGEGLLEGIASVRSTEPRAVFLLAQMSSKKNLITDDYTAATVALAERRQDVVCGLVCQQSPSKAPGLVRLTPGVKLDAHKEALGQTYRTPSVVMADGADIAVVGRGIIAAKDPAAEALRYKRALWDAYLHRLN